MILEDDFLLAKMLSKCVSPQRVTAMSHSLVRACERKRTAVGFVKVLFKFLYIFKFFIFLSFCIFKFLHF